MYFILECNKLLTFTCIITFSDIMHKLFKLLQKYNTVQFKIELVFNNYLVKSLLADLQITGKLQSLILYYTFVLLHENGFFW